MTDLLRLSCLQLGAHTGPNDFDDVATNPSRLLRPDQRPWLGNAWSERLARDWQTCDGEHLKMVTGAQQLDTLPDIPFAFRGLSGGGAPNAIDVSTLDLELQDILEHVHGQASTDGLGDDLAVGGTATTVRPGGAPAAVNVGNAILVPMLGSGKNQARMVLSEDGTDYAVERPFTDGLAADAPAAAGNIYASRTFALSTKGANLAHLFIDFESELTRLIYRGIAIGSLALAFTNRGIAMATVGGMQFNSFEGLAPVSPSPAEPDHGDEILHFDSPFWIGNTEAACKDTTVTITKTLGRRDSACGVQGAFGYAVDDYDVELSTMIRFGDLDLEANVAMRDLLQGGVTTQDLAFQSGRQPGAACYFRMPEADVQAQEVADGAHIGLQLTARATGLVPSTLSIF